MFGSWWSSFRMTSCFLAYPNRCIDYVMLFFRRRECRKRNWLPINDILSIVRVVEICFPPPPPPPPRTQNAAPSRRTSRKLISSSAATPPDASLNSQSSSSHLDSIRWKNIWAHSTAPLHSRPNEVVVVALCRQNTICLHIWPIYSHFAWENVVYTIGYSACFSVCVCVCAATAPPADQSERHFTHDTHSHTLAILRTRLMTLYKPNNSHTHTHTHTHVWIILLCELIGRI